MDENDHDNNPIDLDDLLPQIGEFGKYQKLLVWFICLPACFPCSFGAFNQLFMADTPEHWCKVPGLMNATIQARKDLAIPRINDTYSQCKRFAVNWTKIIEEYNDTLEDIIIDSGWPVEKCLDGWEFNKSEVTSSIVIDFHLVCEKDIYPTLGLVALNLGGPIGVYMFGILNDQIGRKKSFFLCLSVLISGSVLTALAQNFWFWALSRVVVGLTNPAMYQIPFIIALELVGPNYRSFITVMACMFNTMGLMMLSGVTYLIRDWVHLTLVTSLPFLFYFLYWFFLPESPRWLLVRGQFEEASKILENLARVNGKELPLSMKHRLKRRMKRTESEDEHYKKNPSIKDLCRTPNMRLKTILITFNWFANEMVYVGLSYYGPALGSNQYLSFLLSAVVEIPSTLTCWIVMDRWGRRWPLSLCMIISGACCIVTVTLPSDAVTVILILYLISKSTISASFLIIYPFAGELYPTQLRGIGIGTSAYIGGLGLIIIPFITYLGSEDLIIPLIILGIISVVGGLTGLRLPETLHYRLPQTVEEGEEFGKKFSLDDCLRCIPIKPGSRRASYENLELEPIAALSGVTEEVQEKIPIRKLARQSSVLYTQKDNDGTMKMAYWF